jgi:hypothetical protein
MMMRNLPINSPLVRAYKHHAIILSMMDEHPASNLKGVIPFDKSRPVCRRIRYSAG